LLDLAKIASAIFVRTGIAPGEGANEKMRVAPRAEQSWISSELAGRAAPQLFFSKRRIVKEQSPGDSRGRATVGTAAQSAGLLTLGFFFRPFFARTRLHKIDFESGVGHGCASSQFQRG